MKRIIKKNEARSENKVGQRAIILGVPVDSTQEEEVLTKIVEKWKKSAYDKALFVVTAYSEFFLEAIENPEFTQAIMEADLVVPDGVSAMAAADYLNGEQRGLMGDVAAGLKVGRKVLMGKYSHRVVGVKLAEKLLGLAKQQNKRVFLLGGWNGVAQRLAEKWRGKGLEAASDEGLPNIKLAGYESPEDRRIVMKINAFEPDLLLVSLGRISQEIWIHKHLGQLKAKVVIGVGSAFDELMGEGVWARKTPEWVEAMGLKWLWRVTQDPKHIKRAWRAFPVFAWKVFLQKRYGIID
jgi:N-acetylglucosaminyldiphosphoundecaprenol N-acetyl-beta-D-mannosaminyltransferase